MGYKSRSTINKIELGKVDISRSKIAKFAEALNVPPSYLMGWDEPNKVINEVNFLDSDSSEYYYCPYSVAAGELTTIEGLSKLPKVSLPDCLLGKYAGRDNVLLMPVNGASMNNIIEDGATIAVLTGIEFDDVSDGDIVVVSLDGDYTLKHFYNDKTNRRVILRPDSSDPSFTDIVRSYDEAESLTLVGRVVMYCNLI